MQIEVLDQERDDHLYVKPSNNWMLKSIFSRLHLSWIFVIVLSCRASCSAMLAFLLGDYRVGGELTIFISVWLSDFHIVMLIKKLTCWTINNGVVKMVDFVHFLWFGDSGFVTLMFTCWTAGSMGLLRLLTAGPCWASIRPCQESTPETSLSETFKLWRQNGATGVHVTKVYTHKYTNM